MSPKKKGTSKKTSIETPSNTPNPRGRPKHTRDMKKITLTVNHDQIIWLDRLATDIREASRVVIDRGAIIRSLIAALENSKLDLTSCSGEKEMQEAILKKLKAK